MDGSTTITLRAADDGSPIPPGALTYAIAITCFATSSTADRKFWSYDGDPVKAAILTITYEPR